MESFQKLLIAAVVIGLVSGMSISIYYSEDSASKCEKTEKAIKNQSNVTGAVACFPPGVIDLNQTDRVQQGSNLECVCRRSFEGAVQLWAINKAR